MQTLWCFFPSVHFKIHGATTGGKTGYTVNHTSLNISIWYFHVEFFLYSTPMMPAECVLPSSANHHIEASMMYKEAIQKLKDMEWLLHPSIQEQPRGAFMYWHHKHTWIRSYVLHNWIYQTWKENSHGYPFRWPKKITNTLNIYYVVHSPSTQIM
jgi:hypothetical protein